MSVRGELKLPQSYMLKRKANSKLQVLNYKIIS